MRLPTEGDNFHADENCPMGSIRISHTALTQYVENKKDFPLTFYFNGKWPCLSFASEGNIVYGDIPINPTLIQKHIYNNGSRYWKRWYQKQTPTTKKSVEWIIPIILVFSIVGMLSSYCIGKNKNR
jgi:hypothetical protein